MRADLLVARKARDKVAEVALKRALALLDNAAAPPAQPVNKYGADRPTEVPRLALSEADHRRLLQAELDESEIAAQQYADGGRADAAERLRAEAAVIESYLR